jgi:formylglycine-generating enzyme required for sulfatase activity
MIQLFIREYGIKFLIISFLHLSLRGQSQKTDAFNYTAEDFRSFPEIIHGIRQDFVRIPKGEFLMGSNERSDEQPVHMVKVNSFDLSTTEVTVLQFRAFVQSTCYRTEAETLGSSFACCWRPKLGITWLNPGFLQGDNEPVVAISWNDATAYCRWLSEETGYDYRLPSEAEWEYSCLAGQTRIDYTNLDSIAWYSENSNGRTHPVGTKAKNNWGLYDMLGNAWEWTSDVYHDSYLDAPKNSDSWVIGGSSAQRGYLNPGEGRVLRGGGWGLSVKNHPASYDLIVTSRPVFGNNSSCNNSGFRVARSIQKRNVKVGNFRSGTSELSAGKSVFEFIWLKPGEFIMGNKSAGVERNPPHLVTFDQPFGIGKTEVTISQFKDFIQKTGYITDAEKKGGCWDSDFRRHQVSKLVQELSWRNPGFIQTEQNPVTCLSWKDAIAFCKWLSAETGKNIRLPSESEWEYAASYGQGSSKTLMIGDSAWYIDNSGLTTHPVGTKKPNNSGLFDMLGNVSEWTMDIWHPDYNGAPEDGSSWLGLPVTARIIRGGSFERELSEMGVQYRDWYDESEVIVGVGFRLLITEDMAN